MPTILGLDGDYVLGVDISLHQGRWDAAQAASAGAQFAFIKASEASPRTGVPFIDPCFERNAASALDAGLLISFYHYLRPAFDVSAQARFFCVAVASYQRHFPLIVDVEDHGGLSRSKLAGKLEHFAGEVQELSGQRAMIYTRTTFWNKYLGDLKWAGEDLLWIARYNQRIKAPWSSNTCKYRPLPWRTWTWWQKSADGNGRGREFGARSADICLDIFNGSYDELIQLSQQCMSAEAPIALPEDALARLWAYALRQGWNV
jgi:GH25 family lysozyme M1 (1,4-beta-N-acetylmuramidase)